jgi:hypothetical protein
VLRDDADDAGGGHHVDDGQLRVPAVESGEGAERDPSVITRATRWALRLSARVQKALDLPGGLSVAQAAERLEVSEPTVRKWLAEGLLERIEGHKPVEIAQRSGLASARSRSSHPRSGRRYQGRGDSEDERAEEEQNHDGARDADPDADHVGGRRGFDQWGQRLLNR